MIVSEDSIASPLLGIGSPQIILPEELRLTKDENFCLAGKELAQTSNNAIEDEIQKCIYKQQNLDHCEVYDCRIILESLQSSNWLHQSKGINMFRQAVNNRHWQLLLPHGTSKRNIRKPESQLGASLAGKWLGVCLQEVLYATASLRSSLARIALQGLSETILHQSEQLVEEATLTAMFTSLLKRATSVSPCFVADDAKFALKMCALVLNPVRFVSVLLEYPILKCSKPMKKFAAYTLAIFEWKLLLSDSPDQKFTKETVEKLLTLNSKLAEEALAETRGYGVVGLSIIIRTRAAATITFRDATYAHVKRVFKRFKMIPSCEELLGLADCRIYEIPIPIKFTEMDSENLKKQSNTSRRAERTSKSFLSLSQTSTSSWPLHEAKLRRPLVTSVSQCKAGTCGSSRQDLNSKLDSRSTCSTPSHRSSRIPRGFNSIKPDLLVRKKIS